MLQSKQSDKRAHFLDFKRINENELTMIMSNQNFYNDGGKWIDDHHDYSSDSDLFGEQSLYSMVNICSTLQGIGLDINSFFILFKHRNIQLLCLNFNYLDLAPFE